MKGIKMDKLQLAELHGNIISEFRAYINREEIETLILGLSGGIDSALVAALARQAIEDTHIKLYGYSLPIHTNKNDEIERASAVGSVFCDEFVSVRLDKVCTSLIDELVGSDYFEPTSTDHSIRAGNIKARLRMVYLYDQARKHKGLVLSTDNYTEYMLGFWTLHGDVGDFGCIQNLWKTEVYELAYYMFDNCYWGMRESAAALLDCINAFPTDGLGITDSDVDQIFPEFHSYYNDKLDKPFGWQAYEMIDKIILEWCLFDKYCGHPVIERVKKTQFKRENPYNIPREKLITYSMYPSND